MHVRRGRVRPDSRAFPAAVPARFRSRVPRVSGWRQAWREPPRPTSWPVPRIFEICDTTGRVHDPGSQFLVATWSVVTPDDRKTYDGELWTHDEGWDARILRAGRLFISLVCGTKQQALEYLELQRRVLSGSARA